MPHIVEGWMRGSHYGPLMPVTVHKATPSRFDGPPRVIALGFQVAGGRRIEVPHEAEKRACARAVRVFLETGSHFLTNADWGCFDGEHKAWIILETDSKEEARYVLPPACRAKAEIVSLNKFTTEKLDEIERQHQG